MNLFKITAPIVIGIASFYFGVFLVFHYHYIYIEPTFTASAYQPNGFYNYYANKTCCLTVPLKVFDTPRINTAYSKTAQTVFDWLGIEGISDQELLQNPSRIGDRTIIVLHNEYVTQGEFDFLNQSRVVYFYPNAMYAKVILDGDMTAQPQITLERGHGYPTSDIKNGFDWKYDNTRFESQDGKYIQCNGADKWIRLPNGSLQLECYTLNPIEVMQALLQVMHK